MDDSIRNRVARATVTVIFDEETGSRGRGFLVHGSYIVTAAHCIHWTLEGTMATEDCILVAVIASDGRRLSGQVLVVELVPDIAVIGCPDAGYALEESLEFDRFAKSVDGLALCNDEFPIGEEFPVHIFTHQGEWISGQAAQWEQTGATLSYATESTVPCGTSGSAIVNERGEVVAVVSNMHEPAGPPEDVRNTAGRGIGPRPCQCLPVWLWLAIKKAEDRNNQEGSP